MGDYESLPPGTGRTVGDGWKEYTELADPHAAGGGLPPGRHKCNPGVPRSEEAVMEERGDQMQVEEATRVIKEHASKQPVQIELTDEQLQYVREQWGKGDPNRPIELTFVVADRTVGELRVASCAYLSDTCCG
jgi:hypothetical protein